LIFVQIFELLELLFITCLYICILFYKKRRTPVKLPFYFFSLYLFFFYFLSNSLTNSFYFLFSIYSFFYFLSNSLTNFFFYFFLSNSQKNTRLNIFVNNKTKY